SPFDGALSVQLEELMRITNNRFLGIQLGFLPLFCSQSMECGDLFVCSDIATDEIRLRDRHEQFTLFRILENQKLGFLSEVVFLLFNAQIFSDPIMEVNDEIS